MIILIHVISAISSILATSLLYILPSKRNFKITYVLIGATIGSGTILLIQMPSHLLSICESGLLYLGIVILGLVLARYRLVKSESKSSDTFEL